MDDEFENFLTKVAEVEALVHNLSCRDSGVADRAMHRADLMLRTGGLVERAGDVRCNKDRTAINQKAFDNMGESADPDKMSTEAFKAMVERDAEARARDKRERRKRSDEFCAQANKAFREKRFEKALELYSKAISETRDRCILYENRALTCLRLDLFHRVVDDCDWALRLKENSLKALLYKAKALSWLGDKLQAENCIQDAIRKHPQEATLIHDFKRKWEAVQVDSSSPHDTTSFTHSS